MLIFFFLLFFVFKFKFNLCLTQHKTDYITWDLSSSFYLSLSRIFYYYFLSCRCCSFRLIFRWFDENGWIHETEEKIIEISKSLKKNRRSKIAFTSAICIVQQLLNDGIELNNFPSIDAIYIFLMCWLNAKPMIIECICNLWVPVCVCVVQ